MGQTLCNVDTQNIEDQAKQLPKIHHTKINASQPIVINEVVEHKSQEKIAGANDANVNHYMDIHPQPIFQKMEPKLAFPTLKKEQIKLPGPVKQQLSWLGDYSDYDGENFPRGTMIDQIYLLDNGIKYIGQWKQDQIHGKGTFVLQDGSFLEAYSRSNSVTGVGRLINTNGDYFEGQFKQNQACGRGRYKEGNIIYEGQFLNNKPHGKGTEKGQNFYYVGMFQNGKKTQGRLEWKDEHGQYEYQGQFKQNKFDGLGQLIDNGKIIKGKFVGGKLSVPTF